LNGIKNVFVIFLDFLDIYLNPQKWSLFNGHKCNEDTFKWKSARFNFVWRMLIRIIALSANKNINAAKAFVVFPYAFKIPVAMFTSEWYWLF
jgi:hypothetical protein